MKPVTDKAEVALDFPDKAYMGSFGHRAAFDASAESDGIELRLVQNGDVKRRVELHIHYYLFADILGEIAGSIENGRNPIDATHLPAVAEAANRLSRALRAANTNQPKER